MLAPDLLGGQSAGKILEQLHMLHGWGKTDLTETIPQKSLLSGNSAAALGAPYLQT